MAPCAGCSQEVRHCGSVRATTKQQLQAYYEKTSAHQFSGKGGESHRVFVFSAEVFAEHRVSPWTTPVELGDAAKPYLEWIVGQTGPTDVLLLADGRSRQARRMIDRFAEAARHQHEAWLIYRPTRRLGRRVAFAADNMEMVLVSMPAPRTQLAAAPRQDYLQDGEDSTHETTYMGVEPVPWGSLPLIPATGKEKVIGACPCRSAGENLRHLHGHPVVLARAQNAQVLEGLAA